MQQEASKKFWIKRTEDIKEVKQLKAGKCHPALVINLTPNTQQARSIHIESTPAKLKPVEAFRLLNALPFVRKQESNRLQPNETFPPRHHPTASTEVFIGAGWEEKRSFCGPTHSPAAAFNRIWHPVRAQEAFRLLDGNPVSVTRATGFSISISVRIPRHSTPRSTVARWKRTKKSEPPAERVSPPGPIRQKSWPGLRAFVRCVGYVSVPVVVWVLRVHPEPPIIDGKPEKSPHPIETTTG